MRSISALASATLLVAALAQPVAAEGTRITVTGEAIDTWCYFSGVMGGSDVTVGSSHHTCALWCSAGGIPVGLRADDGTVYMVLKVEQDDTSASGDTLLNIASHVITADGMHYQRDGINYLVVSQVTADEGIVRQTHEDFGVVPGFAIPDPK